MRQKKHFSFMKQKSYLTAGVIALVAVVAMAGIYYRGKNNAKDAEAEAIMMADTEWIEDINPTPDTGETKTTEDNAGESADETENLEANNDLDTQEADSEESDEKESEETFAQAEEPELHFSAKDSLTWPLNGDVILNYSMDKSVYFATLDQYKYNPAVIISGEVNDRVVAASAGQVISVSPDAETGITVTVGMGDGYQAIYGQLKQVELEPGDYIERGDIIGFINEPTKYYSVEGSNLYFALIKDGNPINPMDYFE